MKRLVLFSVFCFGLSLIDVVLHAAVPLDSGSLVLAYNVQKGQVFRYQIEYNNDTYENGVGTDYKVEKSYENSAFYYSKEVYDVESNGDIIYKVSFDTIIIFEGNAYTTSKRNYNHGYCYISKSTNIDSSDYLEYYCLIKEPFFIRVTKFGEVLDAYGFQQFYKNINKIYNDTLNDSEIESIKATFGQEQLIDILQREYVPFSPTGVDKNLSWVKKTYTSLGGLESENTAVYKVESRNNEIFSIVGHVKSKLNGNNYTDEDSVYVHIKDYDVKIIGQFTFDMNKGCVTHKETSAKTSLSASLKKDNEEGTTKNVTESKLVVKLLN